MSQVYQAETNTQDIQSATTTAKQQAYNPSFTQSMTMAMSSMAPAVGESMEYADVEGADVVSAAINAAASSGTGTSTPSYAMTQTYGSSNPYSTSASSSYNPYSSYGSSSGVDTDSMESQGLEMIALQARVGQVSMMIQTLSNVMSTSINNNLNTIRNYKS